MNTCVVDTSVLVKYVVPEEYSPIAYGIVDAHIAAELRLIAPEYIMAECANVLMTPCSAYWPGGRMPN